MKSSEKEKSKKENDLLGSGSLLILIHNEDQICLKRFTSHAHLQFWTFLQFIK